MLRLLTQRTGFALVEARPVHPLPLPADGATSLTCLVRVPEALAEQLHETVRGWPAAEAHHVYRADALHLTVLNLAGIDGDAAALARAQQIIHRSAPLSLLLNGFGATSHSVYVRAYDPSGRLGALRRDLLDVTGGRPEWPRRRLGFVNVLRWRSADMSGVLRAVRSAQLGPIDLRVDRAQLVRTDRLFSPAATTVLQEVSFRSPT